MRIVAGVLIGALLGAGGLWAVGFRMVEQGPGTSQEEVPAKRDRVVALGRIVPVAGVISVPIPPTARVVELSVAEGEAVTKGDTLAVLDSRESAQLQLEVAESALDDAREKWTAEVATAESALTQAQLALEQLQAVAEVEDQALADNVAALKLGVEQQQKDLDRLLKLSQDVVSQQQLEHQRLLVEKAQSELRAAEASRELSLKQREYAEKAAKERLVQAEAAVERLKRSGEFRVLRSRIDLAELAVENSTITAPTDGTVLRVFVRPGEAGGQKPLLQMGDLRELNVVAEVFQTDVPHVDVGKIAKISSDAWPNVTLEGIVEAPDQMVSTPELRSIDPLAPSDRHVVRVLIRLDAESVKHAADWLQMQVDVELPAVPQS